MKPKLQLLKKLATLCCLVVLLGFNSKLCAQIIYTDIPDATPNASYPLDLNNDLIVDFILQFDRIDKVICIPQNNNAYSGDFAGGEYLPWAYSSSTNICNSLIWYDATNPGIMAWGTNMGYWVGATNKYLALKLMVGANTYYGWARLDFVSSSSSFTIKDYAYEGTPNACIQSGRTSGSSIIYTTKRLFSILPNPVLSNAIIQLNSNLNNATLTLCNSHGQIVKQINNISGQTITLSLGNLPNGLYYIRLTEGNKIIAVDKLIITH